jgi:hypothetical protein
MRQQISSVKRAQTRYKSTKQTLERDLPTDITINPPKQPYSLLIPIPVREVTIPKKKKRKIIHKEKDIQTLIIDTDPYMSNQNNMEPNINNHQLIDTNILDQPQEIGNIILSLQEPMTYDLDSYVPLPSDESNITHFNDIQSNFVTEQVINFDNITPTIENDAHYSPLNDVNENLEIETTHHDMNTSPTSTIVYTTIDKIPTNHMQIILQIIHDIYAIKYEDNYRYIVQYVQQHIHQQPQTEIGKTLVD